MGELVWQKAVPESSRQRSIALGSSQLAPSSGDGLQNALRLGTPCSHPTPAPVPVPPSLSGLRTLSPSKPPARPLYPQQDKHNQTGLRDVLSVSGCPSRLHWRFPLRVLPRTGFLPAGSVGLILRCRLFWQPLLHLQSLGDALKGKQPLMPASPVANVALAICCCRILGSATCSCPGSLRWLCIQLNPFLLLKI